MYTHAYIFIHILKHKEAKWEKWTSFWDLREWERTKRNFFHFFLCLQCVFMVFPSFREVWDDEKMKVKFHFLLLLLMYVRMIIAGNPRKKHCLCEENAKFSFVSGSTTDEGEATEKFSSLMKEQQAHKSKFCAFSFRWHF